MDALLTQHASLIAASGIAPDVAEARGYRSVTLKNELARLGFSQSQRLVPTLLIPVHTVHGNVGTYQHRPDTPRIVKGKSLKYETPSGSRMVLDVPPAARQWLVSATGRRTVPQVFVGERTIGGYEELRALDEAGELAAIVGGS